MFRMVAVGARRHQDVSRLHIAVHQIVVVRRVQRGGDLAADPHGGGEIERPAPVDEHAQIGARHIAHRDVEETVRLTGLEDRHDVGVVDRGRHP